MAPIRCPGCSDVIDAAASACPGCGRCPGCGDKRAAGEAVCPGCDHPADAAGLERLQRSFGIPKDRLEQARRRADFRRRVRGGRLAVVSGLAVFALIVGSDLILTPLGLFFWPGHPELTRFALAALVGSGTALVHLGLPLLVERGWFPWLLRERPDGSPGGRHFS